MTTSHARLEWFTAPGGAVQHGQLLGVIDETFDFRQWGALSGALVLDVGRIERITSFGVRKWSEFVRQHPPGVTAIYVLHAGPMFVDQLNMVLGFGGVAQFVSVLVPYVCGQCGAEQMRVLEVSNAASLPDEPPKHTCAQCGGELRFDEVWSEYIDYFRQAKKPALETSVSRYLALNAGRPAETGGPMKIVEGEFTVLRLGNVLNNTLNVRRLTAGLEGTAVFDLGSVALHDGDGVRKLQQALDAASQTSVPILWRVTPELFEQLGTTPALLGSVQMKSVCSTCASQLPVRLLASDVEALAAAGRVQVTCRVCPGEAIVDAGPVANSLAQAARATATITAQIAALEPKLMAQLIGGGKSDGSGVSLTSVPQQQGAHQLDILKRLGRGGMADVFLARQQGMKGFEKYVVVKRVLDSFAGSPEFVEMLFAEARANARLTHPNIVQTFDVGMSNNVAYILMEYVRGPDLKKLMNQLKRTGKALPVPHALRLVADAASGLHYAHSYVDPTGKPHPMVHRDVSPHNVLVSLDGAIKLSDFGIAKVVGEAGHTATGTFKGKVMYVSPEAIAGLPIDARHDVFSLGVTLFELLTGQLPFRRDSDVGTLQAIIKDAPPDITRINGEVPADVAQIVYRAMEKDPNRRTGSAGRMRDEIEAVMARHGWAVSASTVARFCEENLGSLLQEYSRDLGSVAPQPGGLNASLPPPPISSPVPPVPPETGGTDPGQGGQPEENSATLALTPSSLQAQQLAAALNAGKPGAAQSPHAAPRASMPEAHSPARATGPGHRPSSPSRPGVGSQPQMSPVPSRPPSQSQTNVGPVPSRPPSQQGMVPVPSRPASQQGLSPVPSRPPTGQGFSPVQPPRPSSQQGLSPVPSRPASQQGLSPVPSRPPSGQGFAPVPSRPPSQPSLGPVNEPPTQAEVPRVRSRRPMVALAAGIALTLVGFGIGVALRGGSQAVTGLKPGDELFVGGVEVEPDQLKALTSGDLVAIARENKVVAFGQATGQRLDASSLFRTPVDVRGDLTASLTVKSEPSDCHARLGGKELRTPIAQNIPANAVIDLEVACPKSALWRRRVVGVPSQSIELLVKPE